MSQKEKQIKSLDDLAGAYIEHLCGEVLCWKCDHYFGNNDDGPSKCKAFPSGDGIPKEIMYEGVDHREPYEGDNGIQFKPKLKLVE